MLITFLLFQHDLEFPPRRVYTISALCNRVSYRKADIRRDLSNIQVAQFTTYITKNKEFEQEHGIFYRNEDLTGEDSFAALATWSAGCDTTFNSRFGCGGTEGTSAKYCRRKGII